MSVSRNAFGMVPPTLLTTMSSRPNSSYAACAKAADPVEVREVGLDHERPPTGGLDPLRDLCELRGVPRGDDHVGARLGERHRRAGADASAGAGDDGNLAVDLEPVQNHAQNYNRF